MTVREAIELLSKQNPDALVCVGYDGSQVVHAEKIYAGKGMFLCDGGAGPHWRDEPWFEDTVITESPSVVIWCDS